MKKLVLAFCAASLLVVSACATKISPSTVQAACQAIAASDMAFNVFVQQHPGKVDANGIATEATIMHSVGLPVGGGTPSPGMLCAPPYSLNTATDEATAISAALSLADLLTLWQK